MKFRRALMSLEISLSGKLFVATVDPAGPHGGVRGFLWGGFVLVLGLFLVGVPLLVRLRTRVARRCDPMMRVAGLTGGRNGMSNECYAQSALIVGPSLFYTDSLGDLTAPRRTALQDMFCRPPRSYVFAVASETVADDPGGDLWRRPLALRCG
jgi:hypothetical protein